MVQVVNSLRPRQNRRRFADDTFKRIFLNENVRIAIKISLKFVHKGPINNNPALVQIMAWRRPGDKPLSEPMMVSLLTHICVTRPQWVKSPWWKTKTPLSCMVNIVYADDWRCKGPKMATDMQVRFSNSTSLMQIVIWFNFPLNLFPMASFTDMD